MVMGSNLIERAIELAGGSEAKLASKTGLSQPLINKAKKSGRAGPKLALAIDDFTKGEISKSALRPDLWTPADNPSSEGTNTSHEVGVA